MPDENKRAPNGRTNEKQIWMADKVTQRPLTTLQPYKRNNRVHNAASIARLKASVATFGFVVPILIDKDHVIIAGHGRYEAARRQCQRKLT